MNIKQREAELEARIQQIEDERAQELALAEDKGKTSAMPDGDSKEALERLQKAGALANKELAEAQVWFWWHSRLLS